MSFARLMLVAFVLWVALAASCALAIPVRVEPMTLGKADAKGNQALTPNTPDPGVALGNLGGSLLGMVATAFGGPWGDLAATAVAALLGAGTYSVGRRHGRAKAAKPAPAGLHPASPHPA